MENDIKTALLIILTLYSVIISVLFWTDNVDRSKRERELTESINRKESELKKREGTVIDKEMYFRELTKLKMIQSSALDILKSYSIQNNIVKI